MNSIKKYFYIALPFIILITVFLVQFLTRSSENEIRLASSRYNDIIGSNKIKKIVIYCDCTNDKNTYRVNIHNRFFELFQKMASIKYQKNAISGRYNNQYLVQIGLEDGQKYFFLYAKKYNVDSACKWKIPYKGEYIQHSYNDCTQLVLLENKMSDADKYLRNQFAEEIVSYYNFELIDFFEKHVDAVIKKDPEKYIYRKAKK